MFAPLVVLVLHASPGEVVTLDDALARAREASPLLRQAAASRAQAHAQADAALSPWFPQLSGDASYSRSTGNGAPRGTLFQDVPSLSLSGDSWDRFSAGVSLHQLVWDFGRTNGRLGAAARGADAGDSTAEAVQVDVTASVRVAWLRAVGTRALAEVAQQALLNQQKHQALVEAQIQVGVRPPIDLQQVKTDVANARAQLIAAQTNDQLARLELGRAIGTGGAPRVPDGEAAALMLPAVAGEDGPLAALVEDARSGRADLRAAEQQMQARAESVGAARGGYWPALAVAASADASGPRPDRLAPNASAGVALSWPLFEGFATRADVAQAEAALNLATAARDVRALQVAVDVEQAQLLVASQRAQLAALEEAEQSAHAALDLAESRYQTGAGSIIELGDAQLAYVDAAARRVQAMTELSVARAALSQALGRP